MKKLISLDETFETFDERLLALAQVVGVPYESLTEREASSDPVVRSDSFHGRAEWGLRWLLGKLRLENENGPEARANPKSWALLQQLICRVPVSIAGKSCSAQEILSTVEKTLAENYPDQVLEDGSDNLPGSLRQQDEASDRAGLDAHETPSKQASLKRKRDNDVKKGGKNVKLDDAAVSPASTLLPQILGTFKLMIQLSAPTVIGAEMPVAEQLKAVLHTNGPHAARLMKLWLNALTTLFMRKEKQKWSHSTGDMTLDPLLFIWDLSNVNAVHGPGSPTALFSSQCLLHSTLLLSLTAGCSTDFGSNPSVGRNNQLFSALQTQLAKHTFFLRMHFSFKTKIPIVVHRRLCIRILLISASPRSYNP